MLRQGKKKEDAEKKNEETKTEVDIDEETVLTTASHSFSMFQVNFFLIWNIMGKSLFEASGKNTRLTSTDVTQLTFTCSKSTIETLEKCVKYVQI